MVCIDEQNPYFQMIHSTWGQRLREVFEASTTRAGTAATPRTR
jgi:predicted proteasome-type protease